MFAFYKKNQTKKNNILNIHRVRIYRIHSRFPTRHISISSVISFCKNKCFGKSIYDQLLVYYYCPKENLGNVFFFLFSVNGLFTML